MSAILGYEVPKEARSNFISINLSKPKGIPILAYKGAFKTPQTHPFNGKVARVYRNDTWRGVRIAISIRYCKTPFLLRIGGRLPVTF
jgi:hypothetical protein